MDLLEYQGKQLFARHGVPVPSGSRATTVEQAVAAADETGYPSHAGAIVSGTAGTAAAKQEALEARGVRVGRTPTSVAEIAAEIAGSLKTA
jgi:succinyl-CoA synthetase beta subunit